MKQNTILFIGMDTHKVYTEIAYTLEGKTESKLFLTQICYLQIQNLLTKA